MSHNQTPLEYEAESMKYVPSAPPAPGLPELQELREFKESALLVAANGHPNPCNLGPLCPYCEIDRLRARLAALTTAPVGDAPIGWWNGMLGESKAFSTTRSMVINLPVFTSDQQANADELSAREHLEQAYEWLEEYTGLQYEDGDPVSPDLSEIEAFLKLGKSNTTPTEPLGTEYDKAVEALAPYLPDGWVAQDSDGDTLWFLQEPERGYHGDDTMWFTKFRGGEAERLWSGLATSPDWRTSLRRIESGRVVKGGEG